MEDLDTLVLRQAAQWRDGGLAAVLVTVARTWGSSPRPPGSLMAINARGETVGSVSGGCIEDDLIQRIRDEGIDAVCARQRPVLLRYGVSADQAHRFGLPCGGTVELVLEPLQAHSLIPELLAACTARQSVERRLHLTSGQVSLRPADADGLPRQEGEEFITPFGPRARLLLIGAGDLARFMAEMAGSLGFEVLVCDPRAEQQASWNLPGVTVSPEMPDDLVQRMRPDARTAVVALTHDPKIDDLALMEALQSEAFYVAAIGSRRTALLRRERLAQHFGMNAKALERLRSPAGLYIGSKTPAEIALSIMAELVACKNGVTLPPQAQVEGGKAAQAPQKGLRGTA
ncbi:xanthine dehydrogenase accessory factor [Inhella inkyongensis]|uniref:Xanthine dehydrogenase accessory factor n=1 Tax=Inhella inkyongensis TaxID=392593 RepID=A0A840RZ03_9BURK|nr:XdhC family protein [Inhella inkyongensis]MBB5203205.1 xanthine dehydrogenase accessory factor [Inhella inkyongensis]